MVPLMLILASKFLGELNLGTPKIRIDPFWYPVNEYLPINGTPVQDILTSYRFNDDYQRIIVPPNVAGLTIICNASYPIQWDFTDDNWEKGNLNLLRITTDKSVHSVRKAPNMYDKSTYEFIQELKLFGVMNTISGNYTCRSTEYPEVRSAIYVFWAGSSPPYLIHSGKNKTIYRSTADGPVSPLILPCTVSTPDVTILLHKQLNNVWENVDSTQIDVSYEPDIGFIIKNPDVDIEGHYRCVVQGDDDDDPDYVLVDVVAGSAPVQEEFHERAENNATFGYDDTNHKFFCCSDNWKPPKLQLVSCDDPVLCSVRKQTLGPVKNIGRREPGKSCTNIALSFEAAGLIRCRGHGIQVDREYFLPSDGLSKVFGILLAKPRQHRKINITSLLVGKPYYHWSDARADDLVEIIAEPKEMFAGQTITFYCIGTPYYFAEGKKWSIAFNNHSRIVRDAAKNPGSGYRFAFRLGYSALASPVDINMISITCSAPVWNSTKWIEKTLDLSIKEPTLPKIKMDNADGKETKLVEITWYLNETNKTLNCSVIGGNPIPVISWTHDGKNEIESRRENNSSIISIDIVHVSSHGEYTCSASNVAGVAVKKFYVKVLEKKGSNLAAYMAGGTILAITFIFGVGLLVRKLKLQSTTISHLKTVAFKDVISRDHNNGYGFNYPSPPSPPTSFISTVSIDRSHQENVDVQSIAIIDSLNEQENEDKSLNNFAFTGGYHKF